MWKKRSLESYLREIQRRIWTHKPTVQRSSSGINPANQSSADRARAFKGIIKVVDTLSLTYELESGTSDPGSLAPLPVNSKAYVQFWKRISASPFITECIRGGYKIPFYLTPPTTELKNNSNTLKHSDFVQSAILELVTSAG